MLAKANIDLHVFLLQRCEDVIGLAGRRREVAL